MSIFYDNSIVPNELKRNFDVYDRIKELNIDQNKADFQPRDYQNEIKPK